MFLPLHTEDDVSGRRPGSEPREFSLKKQNKNKSHFNNDSLLCFLFLRLLCKYSCSLDEYFVVFFSLKKEQMFVCFNYIICTFLGLVTKAPSPEKIEL